MRFKRVSEALASMSEKSKPQHRGGLVPVGDITIDVPGVGRKLSAKRQARHFTRLDQAFAPPPDGA